MRFVSLIAILTLVSCSNQNSEQMPTDRDFTYLALGDSYTIGEAVEERERWPVQLAEKLRGDSIRLQNPEIIATTGWTTDELLSGIVKSDVKGTYDFVSLLIGVNNQYRGYDEDQYEKEFKVLLKKAIEFANGNPRHVIVVSIPDYGVTPFTEENGLDKAKIAHELDSYNAIAQKIAALRDVEFINITPISRQFEQDTSFVASDGLHPSGKMYTLWVEEMYERVYTNLSSR